MKRFMRPLDSNGFTLTEAMVVVTLVAIMTGFSYSGFSSWIVKERARSAANQLAGDLREGRIRSIEKHTSHAVIYNANTQRYQLIMDSDHDLNKDENEAEILGACTNPSVTKVIIKNPENISFSFDVRGFPQQQGSILFLSQHADPSASSCLNNDCCKTVSAQNGPSCGNNLCCAVCVSYGDIKVTCNDGY